MPYNFTLVRRIISFSQTVNASDVTVAVRFVWIMLWKSRGRFLGYRTNYTGDYPKNPLCTFVHP